MFIVEGLDYAGKSTALKTLQKLIKQQRWERWVRNGLKHTVSEIQAWGKLPPDFEYPRAYIMATHKEQLCDRFVLSELAYGEVFRGGPHPKFDSHARRLVARELNVTGSVTLLVKADWETTLRRASERCKDEFDAAVKVRQTYDNLTKAFQNGLTDLALGRRGGSYLGEYDTSGRHAGPDLVKYFEACEDVLDWNLQQWRMHLERSAAIMKACPSSWGYLWPKILFVGENINHATADRPFAGDNCSSRTLSDLLDGAGIGEKDLYLWNAYKYSDDPLLTKEGVIALAPKLVVSLGREADERLAELKINHVTFPHPQWIGRFQRKEMSEWALKLKTLCAPALAS